MFAIDKATDQREAQTLDDRDASTMLFRRVLVVDDCPHARMAVSTALRVAGLTIETAEDGQNACRLALAALEAGQPFDLILMDLDMPVMDGYVATEYLREHGYCGRIIALTANSSEDAREQCYITGCDDFATKPITFEALLHLAKRNLEAARASISLAEARKLISASRIRPPSVSLCT